MWKQVLNPLLNANGKLYSWINKGSLKYLESHGNQWIPKHITANQITTARTSLVIPTLYMYSNGFTVLPALCVVANVTFDYVDGAVARWEKARKIKELEAGISKPDNTMLHSARSLRLQQTFGAYYDAVADKAFAIPVWLCQFQHFSDNPILQSILLTHIAVESFSCFVRTKAFYDEPSPSRWITHTETPGNSAVIAGIAGKTKQMLAMLGTSSIMIPLLEDVGAVLLGISVPLAVLSVSQKFSQTMVYTEIGCTTVYDSRLMGHLEECRGLGSNLLVGVRITPDVEHGIKDELIHCLRLNASVHAVTVVHEHDNFEDFKAQHNISVIAPSFQGVEQHDHCK